MTSDQSPPTDPPILAEWRSPSWPVRAAGCTGAAILVLVFATFVAWELGIGGRDFDARFSPLLTIAWTAVWTLGAAALLLTHIGLLAAPLPRWLLRLAPWALSAFFAVFACLHLLSAAGARSGDWRVDLQGPLLLLLAGLCIVVASEEPAG